MPELVKLKNERDVKLAEVVACHRWGFCVLEVLVCPFFVALERRRSKLWQLSRRPGRPFENQILNIEHQVHCGLGGLFLKQ